MKVPLFKQTSKRSCGPAALRMVLAYYGINIPEKEIIKGVGDLKKYGVRTIKLADFTKKLGFKVECLSYSRKLAKGKAITKKPSPRDIFKYLKRKIPVILAVNSETLYNKKSTSQGHFIVITKHRKGTFFYNDSKEGKQHKIKKKDLLLAWYNNVANSSAYLLMVRK